MPSEVTTLMSTLTGMFGDLIQVPEFGGSPGMPEQQPPGVVINEILAHTDTPRSDSIGLDRTR